MKNTLYFKILVIFYFSFCLDNKKVKIISLFSKWIGKEVRVLKKTAFVVMIKNTISHSFTDTEYKNQFDWIDQLRIETVELANFLSKFIFANKTNNKGTSIRIDKNIEDGCYESGKALCAAPTPACSPNQIRKEVCKK